MSYIPIFITCVRIALCPFMFFSIKHGYFTNTLIIIAGVSDFLDGFLARYLNSCSVLGSILDPLADKLFVNITFFALYLYSFISLPILLLIIVRDLILLIGYSVIFSQISFFPAMPILLGKFTTMLQFFCMLLIFNHIKYGYTLLIFSIILSYFCAILYINDGTRYFYQRYEDGAERTKR